MSRDLALVGAPFDSEIASGAGAAYIFERADDGRDWVPVAKLTAPDGVAGDSLGVRIDIDGTTAIAAAAVGDLDRVSYAYVFDQAVGWAPVARLVPSDGVPLDGFGSSVAVSGDTAVVASVFSDIPGGGGGGAAYVFERNAGGPGQWGEVAKLTPAAACRDTPSYCGRRTDSFFGSSIAIHGDTILVGSARDFVYFFQRGRTGRWHRAGRPVPEQVIFGNNYGISVAVGERIALVGTNRDIFWGGTSGAAYILESFPDRLPRWTDVTRLLAPDGEAGDWLGVRVDLDGTTAILGAPHRGIGRLEQGEAYVFRGAANEPESWRAVANLVADDGDPFDQFGNAVAVSGNTVLIGAEGDDDLGGNSGAVYVFEDRSAERARGAGIESHVPDLDSAGSSMDDVTSPGEATEDTVDGLLALTENVGPSAAEKRASLHETWGDGETLCVDFGVPGPGEPLYCDGLELTRSGETLTGRWVPIDRLRCDEFDAVDVSGTYRNGRARVYCDGERDACPFDATWAWILDAPFEPPLIMLRKDEFWNLWFEDLGYVVTPGLCPRPSVDPADQTNPRL